MTTQPQNWKKIRALFQAALEMDSGARLIFLLDKCPDRETRAEVERLLAEHDEAGGVLSVLALGDFSLPPEAPTQRLLGGELLAGRFRILRFIASGGMGEVYEADDRELRERVRAQDPPASSSRSA
jgi:eukaryotic-like serine/threonine-protein kinase